MPAPVELDWSAVEAIEASAFSPKRDRLLSHEVAAKFFGAVRQRGADHMGVEHFRVGGKGRGSVRGDRGSPRRFETKNGRARKGLARRRSTIEVAT